MKFYCANAEEVLTQMNTSENGLTEAEAQKRLEENGKNRLEAAKG
jgi:Ca2+-transporting ATPase